MNEDLQRIVEQAERLAPVVQEVIVREFQRVVTVAAAAVGAVGLRGVGRPGPAARGGGTRGAPHVGVGSALPTPCLAPQ
jgi:hypothetical protein